VTERSGEEGLGWLTPPLGRINLSRKEIGDLSLMLYQHALRKEIIHDVLGLSPAGNDGWTELLISRGKRIHCGR